MGTFLVSSSSSTSSRISPSRFNQIPNSIHSFISVKPYNFTSNSQHHRSGKCSSISGNPVSLCLKSRLSCSRTTTKAVVSEIPYQNQKYSKIGAVSVGPIPSGQLLQIVEIAAKTGAEVVMEAVTKPRNITYKGLTDLVTDTDKMSEAAILSVVRKFFADHLILGEEGGVTGDSSSDYLWCIDPLAAVAKMYSASVVDNATTGYFFELQETAPDPIENTFAEILFWSS